jgi:hypothetical protein
MPNANTSIFLVPWNRTNFLHSIDKFGYAEAEFFNPRMHCNLPDMVKMGPQDFIICLLYLFGVAGVIASAIYLYWKGRRQESSNNSSSSNNNNNGQRTNRQTAQ